ncbi:hypothetical protein [Leptospira harrisiae]|uniref:Uncharacterized protein n=1 Tax=Leptospira harrisiae TaxID=2023189 RepID=A0A2N0AG51_9LEPT|nr:hypothetical protein [Leptospira harrisiae]PJZ83231.1 hypothetical protein CH364_16230 [Leptospira harrisiae]PKA06720.1 hypothetical protein CH366_18045 [Leptospira harrisiae]
MIFTKREIEEHYPLEERLRLEKAKSQNSVIYWINELVRNQVNGAEDVTSLIEVTKDLISQIEALYAEKETLLEQTKTNSIEEVIGLIHGMEEQLNSMYSEYET